MPKAIKITVKGKVQGVFYRASTKEKANELNVKGWCMNLSNGHVQIHAEGYNDALKSLIDWCHKGSSNAIVENVIYNDTEYLGFEDFSIKRP